MKCKQLKPGTFYLLIKVCKPNDPERQRPIIPQTNAPTEKI